MNKFISGLVLLIVGLGLSFSFTRSNLEQLSSLRAEVSSYDNALSQADELSKLQENLTNRFNQIPAEERERIQKFLPQNIDTVRLTIEIDSIANQNRIDISGLSFATNTQSDLIPDTAGDDLAVDPMAGDELSMGISRSNPDYSSVDMSFSATGTYENLKAFLESLENNLRLTDIQSLKIAPVSSTNNYEFSLVIRTYWLGM